MPLSPKTRTGGLAGFIGKFYLFTAGVEGSLWGLLTLLVISLEPPTSTADLINALREVPAFIASGLLLMMFS